MQSCSKYCWAKTQLSTIDANSGKSLWRLPWFILCPVLKVINAIPGNYTGGLQEKNDQRTSRAIFSSLEPAGIFNIEPQASEDWQIFGWKFFIILNFIWLHYYKILVFHAKFIVEIFFHYVRVLMSELIVINAEKSQTAKILKFQVHKWEMLGLLITLTQRISDLLLRLL